MRKAFLICAVAAACVHSGADVPPLPAGFRSRLQPGDIAGIVMYAWDDVPIRGARILLTKDESGQAGGGRSPAPPIVSLETDSSGLFRIPDVASGRYLLEALALGCVSRVTPLDHRSTDQPTTVTIRLEEAHVTGAIPIVDAPPSTARRDSLERQEPIPVGTYRQNGAFLSLEDAHFTVSDSTTTWSISGDVFRVGGSVFLSVTEFVKGTDTEVPKWLTDFTEFYGTYYGQLLIEGDSALVAPNGTRWIRVRADGN